MDLLLIKRLYIGDVQRTNSHLAKETTRGPGGSRVGYVWGRIPIFCSFTPDLLPAASSIISASCPHHVRILPPQADTMTHHLRYANARFCGESPLKPPFMTHLWEQATTT